MKCYPIVIQNGDKAIHEISVSYIQGKCTYYRRTKYGSFRVISEKQFQSIMDNAKRKGYYIFNYGEFD